MINVKTLVRFILVAVLSMSLCIVAGAQTQNDAEWLGAEEYTLYWGDQVNHSGYFIKVVDFSPSRPWDVDTDYVMLSITSTHEESWSAILGLNNSYIPDKVVFDKRLNITALEVVTGTNIPSPYTKLSVAVKNQTISDPRMVKWIDTTLKVSEESSEDIYIDQRAYFSIHLKNLKGIRLESVIIEKEIPSGFVFDPDMDVNWDISLNPYETRKLDFSLKALKPSTYVLNGTKITLRHEGRVYTKEMNASNITVNGPFMNVSKYMSSDHIVLDDEVKITIDVINEGNRAARVSISDYLMPGAVLISGNTDKSGVIQAGNRMSLNYTVSMQRAGDILVPSAEVIFVDSKEYRGTVRSMRKMVHVHDPLDPMSDISSEQAYQDPYQYYDNGQEQHSQDNLHDQDTNDNVKDRGRLQFLYNIFDPFITFLKNTKDKIL